MGDGGKRRHLTGPVDQRQSIFCRQFNRHESFVKQNFGCWRILPVNHDFTFPNQGQGQVGQGCKVAAGAQTPDPRDCRVDALVEVQNQLSDAVGMNARMAFA